MLIGRHATDEAGARGDGDEAGDGAGGRAERGGVPVVSFSTINQPSIAAEAARLVFTRAWAATPLAPSAEPALNPNQPNHRMPVPIIVERQVVRRHRLVARSPCRLPITATTARAAMPALMWIAVPPAKSSAPRLNSQPGRAEHPVGDRRVHER